MKENIEVVSIKGNLEGVMLNVAVQVSKNGDKPETITRQFVITDETNSGELVEQWLKEHYGPDITITQESVPVEIAKTLFGKYIKEVQKAEVILGDYGSVDSEVVSGLISDDISKCNSAIEEEKEQIEDTAMEYGLDADPDDVVTGGVENLCLEDSDLDESVKQEVERKVEDAIERIEILDEDIRELEKKKDLIEKFGGKKVTFGHLYSEKLASRSSEIVNKIITKVPFGAIAMYYLCYKKSDDFFQQDHSFMQYMIPIDAELGGFDGENFNLEYMDECQQALKDLVYELYQAIPGKEYGCE